MSIKLEVLNNELLISINGISLCTSFSFITNGDYISIYTSSSKYSKIKGKYSDFVDATNTPYASVDDIRDVLLPYSGTQAQAATADKTNTILINETFSAGYDTSRFQITNGTMSIVGGKLRVVCSQATTSGNLTNGLKNAAITSININPTVRSYTALLNYEIDTTFYTVTTSANRQYVGFGIKGTGEKTPQNGGVMISHSSTLADNAYVVNDQENARVAISQVLTTGSKIRLVSRVLNNFFDFRLYVDDVLVKTGKYSGLCENDLQGRFGLFSLFGWGCTFDMDSYKVTDLDYKTYDIAVIGDSIVQNWGVYSYSGVVNWANRLKNESNKAVKLFAKSSQTITDGLSNITEVLAGNPTSIIFSLGTNTVLLNKTLSQINADLAALMAAYDSAGYTGKRYICTMPPIIGNATQNTRVYDANQAATTIYGSLPNYYIIDFWSQLITPSTTAFDPLKANDNYHPNPYGHDSEFTYLRSTRTELF